ncbi:MAG: MFS transporter [Synergistaceae bacterium]|nr:MFS transporter [Synergistaceae bacterium]
MKDQDISLCSSLFARLFIPFGMGYFISVLLGSANAIMSPILVETFLLSPADLGFMTSVYLISFGIAQFPLGVFLDRYGARKTLAPSMLFAVLGAVIFALSQNMWHLIISRILTGVGLSGCLMAAFKAYSDWLPSERLPVVYSLQCLAGGIGGMVSTKPVGFAISIFSWRYTFLFLAAVTLLIALSIWFVPPRDKYSGKKYSLSFVEQLSEMLSFFMDTRFWSVAPLVITAQSMMFAYLYLWVGPWMRDVAMMEVAETGEYMMYAFTGAAAGYFLNGILADFFAKKRWFSWEKMYLYSGVLLVLVTAFITFENGRASAFLWGIVMFLSTMTMIAFPIMRNLYDDSEVGRALSLLNFMIFLISFILQWFIGVVLDFYPVIDGRFSARGYQLSLAVIVILNLSAVVHLYLGLKKRRII